MVDNKNQCLKIKNEIVMDMKPLFKNADYLEGSQKHFIYKDSTQYISQFDLKNKDMVRIECVIMHEEDLKINGDKKDTLEATIYTSEFRKWLNSL